MYANDDDDNECYTNLFYLSSFMNEHCANILFIIIIVSALERKERKIAEAEAEADIFYFYDRRKQYTYLIL